MTEVVPSSAPYRPLWESPAHYFPDGSVDYAPSAFFTINGVGLVWSDHSDSTYASVRDGEVQWSPTSSGDAAPTVVADLPAAPGATSITAVTFRARGAADPVYNPIGTIRAVWRLYNKTTGALIANSSSATLTTSAANYSPVLGSGSLDVALSYLQVGNLCVEIGLPTGYQTVTTYDVWLTITGTGPVVEPPAAEVFFVPEGPGVAPPLRQYPRADGLGSSSARRVWPVPASEQRGIRRVGGYL